MSERLQILFDWQSPEAARGEELRATWGSLELRVGDGIPTRVLDLPIRTVRDRIHAPLYPMAEWICANWFRLLWEGSHPAREGFAAAHELHRVGDGYAFPPVLLSPEGSTVRAAWQAQPRPDCRIAFLTAGEAVLDRAQVEGELRRFVESVVGRLQETGIRGTPLEEEWNAIRHLGAEEREFCEAAGMLGEDPFAMADDGRDALVEAAHSTPPEILRELLPVSTLHTLREDAHRLRALLQKMETGGEATESIPGLRGGAPAHSNGNGARPWEVGYSAAVAFRARLKLDPAEPIESGAIPGFAGVRSLPAGPYFPAGVEGAVVGANPQFAIPSWMIRPERQRFTCCRLLAAAILRGDGGAQLATKSSTDGQKANRAFAAEFLAPAAGIRLRLAAGHLDAEEIEDIASEFAVSPVVIQHQIHNHQLDGSTAPFHSNRE